MSAPIDYLSEVEILVLESQMENAKRNVEYAYEMRRVAEQAIAGAVELATELADAWDNLHEEIPEPAGDVIGRQVRAVDAAGTGVVINVIEFDEDGCPEILLVKWTDELIPTRVNHDDITPVREN